MASCLTPQTLKTLQNISGFSEVALGILMEIYENDSSTNKDILPTKQWLRDNWALYNVNNNSSSAIKTEIHYLIQFKTKLEARLNNIYNRLSKHDLTITDRQTLKERKGVLTNQLEELSKLVSEGLDAAQIQNIAREHLDFVERQLDKSENQPLTLREVRDIESYLELYNSFAIDYTPNEMKKINGVNTALYDSYLKIQSDSQSLYDRYTKLNIDTTLAVAHEIGIGLEDTADDLIAPKKDISQFAEMLRPMKLVGDKVLSIINAYIETAMNKAKTLENKYYEEMKPIFENLKQSSLFNQYGYDIFYDKNKENLVSKYTEEYENEKNDLFNNIEFHRSTSPRLLTKAFRKLRIWQEKNHDVFNDVFSGYNNDGELINPSVYDSIPIKYHEDVKNRVSNFFIDRKLAIKDLQGSVTFNEELAEWDLSHNPYKYKNSKMVSNIKNKSYPYTLMIPHDNHLSEKYILIQSDKALKDTYDFFSKVTSSYFKSLPYGFMQNNNINRKFIPYVEKKLYNTFKTEGWGVGAEKLKRTLGDYVRSTSTESLIYEETDVNGEPTKSLPIHHMMNATKFENGKRVTDFAKKEMDLEVILKSIIPTTTQYRYKAIAQPFIEQAYSTVKFMKEDVGTDKNGAPIAPMTGLKRIKELAKYNMDVFFGKSKESVNTTKLTLMTDSEKKELAEYTDNINIELEEKLSKLKEHFEAEKITQEEYENGVNAAKVTAESRIKSQVKNFSFGQTFRSLIKAYAIKTLGFGLISPANEIVQGFTAILLHSAGGEDFTFGDYMRALKSSVSKKDIKLKKLFNVISHDFEGEQTNSALSKGANYLNEKADNVSKGAVLISTMQRHTIIAKDNSIISLYDAFDENGNWKAELFTDEVNSEWNPNDTTDSITTNNFYAFEAKVKELNIRLFGAYDANNPIKAKASTAGMAIMQFKTWLGEAIAVRFEDKSYSYTLKREVKGRWISLMDVYSNNSIGSVLMAFVTNNPDGLISKDGELDIKNMKKNIMEFYLLSSMLIAVGLLSLALKGNDDDDDDKYGLYLMINLLGRSQQDMTYFMNPSEAKKLQDNLIPMLKMYKDVTDIGDALVKTSMGDTEIKQGVFAHWNRIGKESMETLPLSKQLTSLYKIINSDLTDQ
jgi:hypothetical protein